MEELIFLLTKSVYKIPVWFFSGLMAYFFISGKSMFGKGGKKKTYLVLTGCMVAVLAMSYFGIQDAKEKMLKKYGDTKQYTTTDGVIYWLPDWLQEDQYIDLIGTHIDIAYEGVNAVLKDKYGKDPYPTERINIIIMPMIDVFMQDASHTGWAAGDCSCHKGKTQIRICLRPEVKGETLVLTSRGGYLRPLGWELKNAYNCKNHVGGWDFKPPKEVLAGISVVLQPLQMLYAVSGKSPTEEK